MKASWTIWMMRSFIGLVFVSSLFGPYAISIMLGVLMLGYLYFRDEVGSHL
ncbi:MAG: hypothetical protein ACK4VM_08260 [Bosea sp. (in: a-proteobacteria)]